MFLSHICCCARCKVHVLYKDAFSKCSAHGDEESEACVQVRNAFCAIRPPGHHAGPTGVVACANDPIGSHGFCLLNNIAIAAAYAMNAHRHAGAALHDILMCDVNLSTYTPSVNCVLRLHEKQKARTADHYARMLVEGPILHALIGRSAVS